MKFSEGKFVEEFFERTLKNLEYYTEKDRSNSEKCFYEVTQLINSLLGLIVFIKEKNGQSLPNSIYERFKEKFEEESTEGLWDYRDKQENPEVKTSRTLIRHLRNAIAHARIEAKGNGKDIGSIKFKDKNGTSEFEMELSIEEIRELINMIKDEVVR